MTSMLIRGDVESSLCANRLDKYVDSAQYEGGAVERREARVDRNPFFHERRQARDGPGRNDRESISLAASKTPGRRCREMHGLWLLRDGVLAAQLPGMQPLTFSHLRRSLL